jgi:hypothetical protein
MKFGIDVLREAVTMLDWCEESFNQKYLIEELLTLVKFVQTCGWDILPDQLTKKEIDLIFLGDSARARELLDERLTKEGY